MDHDPERFEEDLAEIVRRIVRVAAPERIILFGSAARGEMGPHSDLDLLVVKRGDYPRVRLTGDIYMSLIGVEYPVDVILATPEEVERYKDSIGLIFAPALRAGKFMPPDRFSPDDPREWLNRARSNLAHAKTIVPEVSKTSASMLSKRQRRRSKPSSWPLPVHP